MNRRVAKKVYNAFVRGDRSRRRASAVRHKAVMRYFVSVLRRPDMARLTMRTVAIIDGIVAIDPGTAPPH